MYESEIRSTTIQSSSGDEALTRMCLHVAVQGRFHCETLPTFITLVWSFSCMDPNVPARGKQIVKGAFKEHKMRQMRDFKERKIRQQMNAH